MQGLRGSWGSTYVPNARNRLSTGVYGDYLDGDGDGVRGTTTLKPEARDDSAQRIA